MVYLPWYSGEFSFMLASQCVSGGTPTSGLGSRLSDGLQTDPLDGLPYPASHFDLYALDQLQEEERETDR